MKTARVTFSIGVASVALLTACMHTGDKTQGTATQLKAAAPAAMSGKCDDIAVKFKYDNVRISSSVAVAAGAVAVSGAPNAPKTAYDAPAHCLVKGVMDERKGADGKNYAIGFEMRLPLQWNGRFFYQANGGLDGSVQVALGA